MCACMTEKQMRVHVHVHTHKEPGGGGEGRTLGEQMGWAAEERGGERAMTAGKG